MINNADSFAEQQRRTNQLLQRFSSLQSQVQGMVGSLLPDRQMSMFGSIIQSQIVQPTKKEWEDLQYKVDLLRSNTTVANEDKDIFECSICTNLAYRPKYLKCCQNFICEICHGNIEVRAKYPDQLPQCPFCKQIIRKESFPKGLQEIFENISVTCNLCSTKIRYSTIINHFEKECRMQNVVKSKVINQAQTIKKLPLQDIEIGLITRLKNTLQLKQRYTQSLQHQINTIKYCEHDCIGQVHEYSSMILILSEYFIQNQRVRLICRYQQCRNCKYDKVIKHQQIKIIGEVMDQNKIDYHVNILQSDLDIEFNDGSSNTQDNFFLSKNCKIVDQDSLQLKLVLINNHKSTKLSYGKCMLCNQNYSCIDSLCSIICGSCLISQGNQSIQKQQSYFRLNNVASLYNVLLLFDQIEKNYFKNIVSQVPSKMILLQCPSEQSIQKSTVCNAYYMSSHKYEHTNSISCLNQCFDEADYMKQLKEPQSLIQNNLPCYFSTQNDRTQQNPSQQIVQIQCQLAKYSSNQVDRWVCEVCDIALCYYCAKQLTQGE